MARDWARWDKDMEVGRRNREIQELASERHHLIRLAQHRARCARQADGEGSNAGDTG
jgi:hypothetical protein